MRSPFMDIVVTLHGFGFNHGHRKKQLFKFLLAGKLEQLMPVWTSEPFLEFQFVYQKDHTVFFKYCGKIPMWNIICRQGMTKISETRQTGVRISFLQSPIMVAGPGITLIGRPSIYLVTVINKSLCLYFFCMCVSMNVFRSYIIWMCCISIPFWHSLASMLHCSIDLFAKAFSLQTSSSPPPLHLLYCSSSEAVVKLLLKKSNLDPNILNNYWPVSNLLFLGKILEKLFFNYIDFLDKQYSRVRQPFYSH